MGQAADPARQEHELRKQALAARIQHFEELVREELDWRARLRRNRTKLIVIGAGGVALLTLVVLARSRLVGRGASRGPATLDDVAKELQEIRKQLERRGGEAMWQRLLVRGVVAAGTAAGAYAARRMMQGERTDTEAEDRARTG